MHLELTETTAVLDERRKTWLKARKARFKKRHNDQAANVNRSSQLLQPREYLRKLIKDRGDLSSRLHRVQASIHAACLQYLPFAMFKLLENMPHPFEPYRDVRVMYHTAGVTTFVNEIPRVIPPVYFAQWATVWQQMRAEKLSRPALSRAQIPPFDADVQILDYSDNLAALSTTGTSALSIEPIEMELDEYEDDAVFDWLYDGLQPLKKTSAVNGPSYRRYSLSVPVMAALLRLSRPLLTTIASAGTSQQGDPNYVYLFNREALITGKSLNIQTPGAPQFEPLFPTQQQSYEDEDWTELNDLHKIVVRRTTEPQYAVAYPYLYHRNPSCVILQVAQYPLSCFYIPETTNVLTDAPFTRRSDVKPVRIVSSVTGFELIRPLRHLERIRHQMSLLFLANVNAYHAFHTIDGIIYVTTLTNKLQQQQQQVQPSFNQQEDNKEQEPIPEISHTDLAPFAKQGQDIVLPSWEHDVPIDPRTGPIPSHEISLFNHAYGDSWAEHGFDRYDTIDENAYISSTLFECGQHIETDGFCSIEETCQKMNNQFFPTSLNSSEYIAFIDDTTDTIADSYNSIQSSFSSQTRQYHQPQPPQQHHHQQQQYYAAQTLNSLEQYQHAIREPPASIWRVASTTQSSPHSTPVAMNDDDNNNNINTINNDNNNTPTNNQNCLAPALSTLPLFQQTPTVNTFAGLTLYNAPAPFHRSFGSTVSAHHVDLIKHWYLEPIALSKGETNGLIPPTSQLAPPKIRQSYKSMVKQWVLLQLHNHRGNLAPGAKPPPRILKTFAQQASQYFQHTKIDWLEAAIQVVRQGHNMLSLRLQQKNLSYLHLDFNFSLQATRTLTTKERKQSHLGHSFHLLRELFKFIKIIVDLHIRFRLHEIDAFQLADALQYTFAHVGTITGIYRYKYRIMHRIKVCKDLKHLIYHRFQLGVPKGPGNGFWQPLWRVWVQYLRGISPLLKEWLARLVDRQNLGRIQGKAGRVTKQRSEKIFFEQLKKKTLTTFLDLVPPQRQRHEKANFEAHLSDAWRCWRSNKTWRVPNMPKLIEDLILRFVKARADVWTQNAYNVRKQVQAGKHLEATVRRKNLGKLTRLLLKAEQERQFNYTRNGSTLQLDHAKALLTTMSYWLESRQFLTIPTPPVNYKHDEKMLTLALDKLKQRYTINPSSKITAAQKKELTAIEDGYDKVDETLRRIKGMILQQRNFQSAEITFRDDISELTPNYEIDPIEKITDCYLDQYLWFEAYRRGLFPSWIKPSDQEVDPQLVFKMCMNINNYHDIWDTTNGSSTVLLQSRLDHLADNIDLTLLNHLLQLIVDPAIADYITARYNIMLRWKDMEHVNRVGIIRGLAFSSFVLQYYGLMIDLLILGPIRAAQLAGLPRKPANFGSFHYVETQEEALRIETAHPIRMYCRYLDQIYILFHFSHEDATELTQQYLTQHPDPNNQNIQRYPNKRCWPREYRMRLLRTDVNLGLAAFTFVKDRMPIAIASMHWNESFVSVYSQENPQLLWSMLGFEIRLVPRLHRDITAINFQSASAKDSPSVWSLRNVNSQEITADAFIRVENDHIAKFRHSIDQMLSNGGNAPFTKIAQRWNRHLLGLMAYYREAVMATTELLDVLVRAEGKVQNRIKIAINSKMPSRFPPVVFYAPSELGGLAMLSMGHILIPESDLRIGSNAGMTTHFRSGLSTIAPSTAAPLRIPVLFNFLPTWETECLESDKVWNEYAEKSIAARRDNRRVTGDDLQDLFGKGLPRVSTLFSTDRQTLTYDKGWRLRAFFTSKYASTFPDTFSWTSSRHDGRLWDIQNYREEMLQALGGVETILEHSLFKGTYLKTWEGVFWEKKSTFEDHLRSTKLTKAQTGGLSQVANRRFVLWWSPTINRSDVYIGYQTQIDLTGIVMHGKLSVLKTAYVQIFQNHAWQQIHQSVVEDLCKVLDQKSDKLSIEEVKKESIHPRKSYNLQMTASDIILSTSRAWDYTEPCSLLTTSEENMQFVIANATRRNKEQQQLAQQQQHHPHRQQQQNVTKTAINKFYLDVQLCWGDYDKHDINAYTREKFLDCKSSIDESLYSCDIGLMIGIDLAYNNWSAFGSFIPGMPDIIKRAMFKIMESSPALNLLRERLRKSLQLHVSQPTEPLLDGQNFRELFNQGRSFVTWMLDASAVYRVTTHRTEEGSNTGHPINGALLLFNPMSGELYMRIIHASVWAGQKRKSQLSNAKSAEEVTARIRSLPAEQRPNQLIAGKSALLEPLKSSLTDYPNLIIKGSELSLPLQSFLDIQRIGDAIIQAPQSQSIILNAYDDWLEGTTPSFTCFSRLLLLLRGLRINHSRTMAILFPNLTVQAPEGYLWPKLTPNEWMGVETKLRDLIVHDYAQKNNISAASLTQGEIKDIILGAQVKSPTAERELQLKELEKQNAERNNTPAATMLVQSTDSYGRTMQVAVSSNHERSQFISGNTWRSDYAPSQQLHSMCADVRQLHLNPVLSSLKDDISIDNAESGLTYIFPANLIRQIVAISDVSLFVMAHMYGYQPTDAKNQPIPQTRLVSAIVLPPQAGSTRSVLFSDPIPHHALLRQYIPLGLFYTIGRHHQQDQIVQQLSPELCSQHCHWYEALFASTFSKDKQNIHVTKEQLPIHHTATITLAFVNGACLFNCYTVNNNGLAWALNSPHSKPNSATGEISNPADYTSAFYMPTVLHLTDKQPGYTLVPFGGFWNYHFSPLRLQNARTYSVQIALPVGFYHPLHRKQHFIDFVQNAQKQQVHNLRRLLATQEQNDSTETKTVPS